MSIVNVYIEIRGDREMLIDGCASLLEYGENAVVLLADKRKIRITGERLKMDMMTDGKMALSGRIFAVDFS